MRYPLVPLVNELTFPLLFFWFCLPFVMLLIIAIIWLQLLLNEGNPGEWMPWLCSPELSLFPQNLASALLGNGVIVSAVLTS
uniref:Uncharacterized protein n=1 Tax=Zonotrichia albicollis TaxID=44394 RepID=A0A8D2N582_ZONAL